MKFFHIRIILLPLAMLFPIASFAQVNEECTIGVACGNATSDGRPLLWKTRDYSSEPDNEVKYNTSYTYNFVYVGNAGTSTYSWMGVNEHGFAIVNSNSTDLEDNSSNGPSNGAFMRNALGTCRTVAEFQSLLDETNNSGRTTHSNFGVIDTTGAAAIYEASGSSYWKYDANTTSKGYVIRTNFALNGGGTAGTERSDRSHLLIRRFSNGDSLNYKSILRYQMRDFTGIDGEEEISIPFANTWEGNEYGYIGTNLSICRYSSVSAAVIHGTKPGEPAGLSTMWALLGNPATTIAVPYWPVCESPTVADGPSTAKLCNVSLDIKDDLFDLESNSQYIDTYKLRDGEGGGLWAYTFPYEDEIFSGVASLMEKWRDSLPTGELQNIEDSIALSSYKYLLDLYDGQSYLTTGINEAHLAENSLDVSDIQIFPNPFISEIHIKFYLKSGSDIRITLCSLTGTKINEYRYKDLSPGHNELIINNMDQAKGINILTIRTNGTSISFKVKSFSQD